MDSNLKYNIVSIPNGKTFISKELLSKHLDLEDNFGDQIIVETNLDKNQEEIIISSNIFFKNNCICARCSEEVVREFVANYKLRASYNLSLTSREFDTEIEISPSTTEIDISDGVRESILLTLPLKILCNDDCFGLCQYCGKNLNKIENNICNCHIKEIDPRFTKLKDLLTKN
ncbi:MAG: DUF177 domain-containing protein [Bacteroidetes bacterium]|nr:DUF177 domain-containing protein [Bacteroidota bacterium]